MLPRAYRLPPRVNGALITSYQSSLFRAKIYRSALPHPRFGFVVSKKVSPRAVDRNRIKRQLRSGIEELLPRISVGYDILFIIQREALASTPPTLSDALKRFLTEKQLLT